MCILDVLDWIMYSGNVTKKMFSGVILRKYLMLKNTTCISSSVVI